MRSGAVWEIQTSELKSRIRSYYGIDFTCWLYQDARMATEILYICCTQVCINHLSTALRDMVVSDHPHRLAVSLTDSFSVIATSSDHVE